MYRIFRNAISWVGLGFSLCVMTGLSACSKQEQDAKEPVLRSVRTLTVAPSEGLIWRELPGVVQANKQAELAFRIPGKLTALNVNEGDRVGEGQVLALLDDTDYRIQLKSREAEYAQVNSDYSRADKLVEQGMISRSDFGKLEAQNATAKANLEAAKQNMAHTQLKAPFAGRIAKRYVDTYEEVSAMQKVYLLQDLSTLAVKVAVPESVMIIVRDSSLPTLTAHFDSIPDKSFPLTVREAASQADAETNTFEVTLSMSSVEGFNILPGMSLTVRGERPAKAGDASRIFLPPQSVMEDANGRFVFIAKVNSSENNRAVVERRDVATGELSNLGLEITQGLAPGDQVVIAGMSKMFDGLEVKLP